MSEETLFGEVTSPFPPTGLSTARSPMMPSLFDLKEIVARRFTVLDCYLDPVGAPTFLLVPGPTKEKFRFVLNEVSKHGLLPVLRAQKGRLVLRILPRPPERRQRIVINAILFAATLSTIFLAGYTLVTNIPILKDVLMKGSNIYLQAALFAVCLIAIIGLHEFGHKWACKIHGLDATLPYFIPGPPPFGTFGALISLRSPPMNRDQLFDVGFSGPLIGFLVTVFVAILSFQTGYIVPASEALKWEEAQLVQRTQWPFYPLLFDLLSPLRPVPSGFSLIFTQLEFAAWVGALLTFLNMLPIWQLDGGHIARAVFGANGHRMATFVGVAILVATGYWFFALFLIIWMFSGGRGIAGVEPLDDVSPLAQSRRMLYVLSLVILVLSFVMMPTKLF